MATVLVAAHIAILSKWKNSSLPLLLNWYQFIIGKITENHINQNLLQTWFLISQFQEEQKIVPMNTIYQNVYICNDIRNIMDTIVLHRVRSHRPLC